MKKSILFIAAMFISIGIYGQEKFSAAEVTVEKKYQNMVYQLDAIATVGINLAKTKGLTASEYGAYVGEQFKHGWNKEAGFKGLVNASLYNISCFLPDPDIEITTNTPEMVKFKSRLVGSRIKNNEPVYGVTYKEYVDFFTAIMSTIGEHLGCKYEISYDTEWMYTTISKK